MSKISSFILVTAFLFMSMTSVVILRLSLIRPEFSAKKRLEDDVYILKKAVNFCRAQKSEKIINFYEIEVTSVPPETKTYIKRKYIMDANCIPVILVY